MSNPILFFIFIIVVDLILKSVRDKKKIEEKKMNREEPIVNKEKPIQKSGSIREVMSTLREEVENERQKELERRQGKAEESKKIIVKTEEQVITQKAYEDTMYWKDKRSSEENRKIQENKKLQELSSENNIREDIIKGIIFSEILSAPKSIENQRNRM